MVDLVDWAAGRRAIVSIDADFFTQPHEIAHAALFESWLTDAAAVGIPVTLREDHVDLVELIHNPVDLVINFDWHMDLRLEFLFGQQAQRPPADASVFETVLASGFAERYVWAHPLARRSDASRVYAAATAVARQPLLRRIHCWPAMAALEELVDVVAVESVFVCRSPGYATEDSDAVFRRLESAASLHGRVSDERAR